MHFAPEELAQLLRAAEAAPSLYNSRPWRFAVRDNAVHVYADQDRRVMCADPDGRQQTIACGAAIFNLRLAIAQLGYRSHVELSPDRDDPLQLATVRRGPRGSGRLDRQLYRHIHARRTNREACADGGIHPIARQTLRHAAELEGARLRPLDVPSERAAAARLIVRAIRTQRADHRLGTEMARWLHPAAQSDGIAVSAWESVPFPEPGLDDHVWEGSWELAVAKLTRDESLFLLSTDGDTVADWITAGQALQHTLLAASAVGLSASVLNQVIESPLLRSELAHVLGISVHPQLVMRVGYPATWPRSTRRRALQVVAD